MTLLNPLHNDTLSVMIRLIASRHLTPCLHACTREDMDIIQHILTFVLIMGLDRLWSMTSSLPWAHL
jgi:hypothetical protein